MKRVLVTGAAGFVGSHTCERLVAEGHHVFGVDDLNDYYPRALKVANLGALRGHPRFDFHEAELRDSRVLELLDACDWVVHLAARAGVRRSFREPREFWATNVAGTTYLLDEALAREMSGFVFASSSSVYGDGAVPTDESAAVQPISPYGESKLQAEQGCTRAAAGGLPVAILRFFTVYGPRQRPDQAIRKFAAAMLAGDPIDLYGDGSTTRDYINVADVTAAISGVLGRMPDLPSPCTLNIGNGRSTPLADLIQMVAAGAGCRSEIRHIDRAPGDVAHTCADISLARRVLGWQPRVSLERGLPIFIDWLRETHGLTTQTTR